jgi:hypothetical protein
MEASKPLQIGILEDEIVQLKMFCKRHLRWAESNGDTVISDQHRMIAELLKDVVEDGQLLIEWLKAG